MPHRARRSPSALRLGAFAATVGVTLAAAFAQPMYGSSEVPGPAAVAGETMSDRLRDGTTPVVRRAATGLATRHRRAGPDDEAGSAR